MPPKKAAVKASVRRTSLPPLDPLRYAPSAQRPVRAKARVLEHDVDIQAHRHDWGQLVFSISGAVRVNTAHATYLVPPARAVWIAPTIVHAVTAVERADLRTVYLHQAPSDGQVWQGCRVIEVTPLLRELVMQLAISPDAADDPRREQCIASLVLDELKRAKSLRLGVDLPQDKRLRRLCEAMLDEPGRHVDLDGWAAEVGASARTVSRLFRDELGSSYAQWRSQVLLARALTLAARKMPMSLIAHELGYASASAFTAMVTRTVGMPPSRFFAEA
jgi:AraC-like DNA-binding protein